MSKYKSYQAPPPERRYKIHPIWQGIGCIMLLVVPVLAFIAAQVLVDE